MAAVMQKFHELHKSLGIFLNYRFDGIVLDQNALAYSSRLIILLPYQLRNFQNL